MATLLHHHGAPVSEAVAFGLSSALTFAYLPFVKVGGRPLIAYRMPPKAIIKGLAQPFAARMRFETFRSPAAGERRLNALLASGKLVGLQTSVYWLPYFPPEMRFHFNAHNLLVYGRDGDDYLISDPVTEVVVRCPAADLARARFARGLLAPKGLLYTLDALQRPEPPPAVWRAAIRKTARQMLAPIPIVGVRGIHTLARRVARLPVDAPESLAWVGHIVRMQEEIGTGGAGFRFLYAAFLQEAAVAAECPALNPLADRLLEIGDGWREFALRAARMIRAREAFDPGLLAQRLHALAERERALFLALRAAVA
jgi:hypothetical protein